MATPGSSQNDRYWCNTRVYHGDSIKAGKWEGQKPDLLEASGIAKESKENRAPGLRKAIPGAPLETSAARADRLFVLGSTPWTVCWAPPPGVSDSVGVGWSPRTGLSAKFPHAAAALLGLGTTLSEQLPYRN